MSLFSRPQPNEIEIPEETKAFGRVLPLISKAANIASRVNTVVPTYDKSFVGPKTSDATGVKAYGQPIIGPMPGKDRNQKVNPIITQAFGARGPHEKYSGGINYGTDFGVPRGTQTKLPKGEWQVIESFDKATVGGPNNAQGGINRGYGNSVLVRNKETGEMLRFSHLRPGGVFVKPGQTIKGGTVIGETGATGNTAGRTGQHLDLEYYDPKGSLADVLATPYYKDVF